MIQHYIKVSKLLQWIESQRNEEDEEIDSKEWERGYDGALDSMKDLLEDFPLEDDEPKEKKK